MHLLAALVVALSMRSTYVNEKANMATDQQYTAAEAAVMTVLQQYIAQVPWEFKTVVSNIPQEQLDQFVATVSKAALDAAIPK
jgi:hypothetical protein